MTPTVLSHPELRSAFLYQGQLLLELRISADDTAYHKNPRPFLLMVNLASSLIQIDGLCRKTFGKYIFQKPDEDREDALPLYYTYKDQVVPLHLPVGLLKDLYGQPGDPPGLFQLCVCFDVAPVHPNLWHPKAYLAQKQSRSDLPRRESEAALGTAFQKEDGEFGVLSNLKMSSCLLSGSYSGAKWMALPLNDQVKLQDAIYEANWAEVDAIMRKSKLNPSLCQEKINLVTVKLYFLIHSVVHALTLCWDTLGEPLETLLSAADVPPNDVKVTCAGIRIPLDSRIGWLWQHCHGLDLVLHLALEFQTQIY